MGKYGYSQYQASGWTKRAIVVSKMLRPPYNFDFSKNREYTALRIAGGNRKRTIKSTRRRDASIPPNAVATGKSITPSTIRSELIAPSRASRNRNDNQSLICGKGQRRVKSWQ